MGSTTISYDLFLNVLFIVALLGALLSWYVRRRIESKTED